MIGVDIVKISRFEKAEVNFVKKFLHPNEFKKFLLIDDNFLKSKFLASIWAIKEAIFKADNSLYEFKNIELKKERDTWEHEKFNISISHEEDFLVAVVLKKKE
ncbi:4'-phosphopantetheinyl transferase superfamily protein [Mycoplasmopsis caviae]|uniref:4'-phosphopantetheinyl transferase superfamily protein n=1 Tax=Mycoplasmopsis caviae TaxID=55603 RepID=A0A3P8MEM8_9BACT|nr:4'-phosphopantetheinyl transferase superfamily protein [Mycoplasmopsis caviae]UUD35221.1 4'-phosphopantetheinyl transferase superfamily protein [Mycoplasmopsis caviae]VDR41996.1 Holo-[acyl-carrier protein]synthase [Mycoplasmopsis caviae]